MAAIGQVEVLIALELEVMMYKQKGNGEFNQGKDQDDPVESVHAWMFHVKIQQGLDKSDSLYLF